MSFGEAGSDLGSIADSFIRSGTMVTPDSSGPAARFRAWKDDIDVRMREVSPTLSDDLPEEERRIKQKIQDLSAKVAIMTEDLQGAVATGSAMRYGRLVSEAASRMTEPGGSLGMGVPGSSRGESRPVGGSRRATREEEEEEPRTRQSSRSSNKRRGSQTSPGMSKKRSKKDEDDSE